MTVYTRNETNERTGPNKALVGNYADLTKPCICKPRDWRASADDDGSEVDCPHHGMRAICGSGL